MILRKLSMDSSCKYLNENDEQQVWLNYNVSCAIFSLPKHNNQHFPMYVSVSKECGNTDVSCIV